MSQRVAILGYGIEGQSAYRYFAARGAEITIYYKRRPTNTPSGVELIERGEGVVDARGYDVVLRSAPINPKIIRTDGRITTTINEFLAATGTDRVIGVTGSKGKGTISTLISAMLQAAGVRTHLAGNIGTPVLDLLPDVQDNDYIVLELSSFQLWDIEHSPHIAVIGMIVPDHLDVHADFEEYVSAKANIARHQKPQDIVVYHPTNQHSQWIANQSPATTKIHYASPEAAYIEDEHIVIAGHKICAIQDVQVPGAHNLENICAALSAVWQVAQDVEAFGRAIRDYRGLEHRIELVRTIDGVSYYDDSFAANGGATEVAVRAFAAPKVLILGGLDRGIDLRPMVDRIADAGYRRILLIGQTAPKLAALFAAKGKSDAVEVLGLVTMQAIVARAKETAQKGDVVLLSPGCASFDMFKDYKVRGDEFKKEVNAL